MTLASQAAGAGLPMKPCQKASEAEGLPVLCPAVLTSQTSRTEDARDAVHARRRAGPPAVLPPEPGGLCRKAPVCSRHHPVDPHSQPPVQGQGGPVGVGSRGLCRGRASVARCLSHLLSLCLCLLAELASSRFWKGEGPRDDRSLEGKERFLLLNLRVSLC